MKNIFEIFNIKRSADGSELVFSRSALVAPSSFDAKSRTVEAILATETPCLMPDYGRGEMVDEILMMSGCKPPDQVPLLDSHDDSTIMKQLGSTREIRCVDDKMMGKRFFDNSPESDKALGLIEGGHLRDGSVRYRYSNPTYIEPRKSLTINRRTYTAGPNRALRIATDWQLIEDSICPIGVDQNAKMRSEFESKKMGLSQAQAGQKQGGSFKMNKILMMLLVQRGLAAESTDEQGLEFLHKLAADEQRTLRIQAGLEVAPNAKTDEDVKRAADEATRKATENTVAIIDRCRKFGIEDSRATEWAKEGLKIETVNERIMKHLELTRTPVSASVEITADASDKFRAAAVDGLLTASIPSAKIEKMAPGAESMRQVSLSAFATECVRRMGKNPFLMSKEEIFMTAMGRRNVGMRAELPAQSSSDFLYVLANVANKSVMVGFTMGMARATWRAWCRKGNLVDFKTTKRVALSDASEMLLVPESGEVQYGKFSDVGENIALGTFGRQGGITRQALINDDASVFDTRFKAFGMRWTQVVNALPYAVLSANAALADTGALFNTTAVTTKGGHKNLASSGAAPSATTFSAMRIAMAAQKAPEGSLCQYRPAFILVGAANEDNANILLRSESLPIEGLSSGVGNIYKNTAIPVCDHNISGNEWYGVEDPNIADTMEVAFLNGNENLTVVEAPSADILGLSWYVYGDATAKALGFRGVYKNPGQ